MLNHNHIATEQHTEQHHFTNITRKKYVYYNSPQFYSANCIQYYLCIQNVFRIKTRLRRYSWTKVLLR